MILMKGNERWNQYGALGSSFAGALVMHTLMSFHRPIMRISHARSRYIYDLYYKREAISKELYDWLLKEAYADAK